MVVMEVAIVMLMRKKMMVRYNGDGDCSDDGDDVYNDGDEDESDRYLHKRRKAVGKAMKKKNGNGEKVEITISTF